MPPATTRRGFALGLAAACALPGTLSAQAQPWPANPFSLGVASGFPLPDGVSLWTRLAVNPMSRDTGVPPVPVKVGYEVALDDKFTRMLQRGSVLALPEHGHAVHVWLQGLPSGSVVFYRFLAGDAVSTVGRSRTAPALAAQPEQLRLALTSCQHFEAGHFSAWRDIAQRELDMVLFVGDYIYENHYPVAQRMRDHSGSAPRDLDAYRIRYALYKQDADLQAAHAAHPFVLMWDDHEVENDYAALTSARLVDPNVFTRQRFAAYQAYWEHQPMPRQAMRMLGANLQLNTELNWGQLAQLWTLDVRQHRDVHACQLPVGTVGGRGGGRMVSAASCAELADHARTLLGQAQERWIDHGLRTSAARWRMLVQPSQVSATTLPGLPPAFEPQVWSDSWDGYPAARERLLASASTGPRNVAVLGGDVHRHVAAHLRMRPNDEKSPVVATEFVTSSISSRGLNDLAMAAMRSANPDVLHGRADERGYAFITAKANSMHCSFMGTPHPVRQKSVFRQQAAYEVAHGLAQANSS